MKTLSIIFILLMTLNGNIYGQKILSGIGFIHPMKDSIKVYEKKQNERSCYPSSLYYLFLSKKDSVKIIKYVMSDEKIPRKMVEIENNIKNNDKWSSSLSLSRSNSFCVFYDDVRITKIYDTVSKNKIIEILKDEESLCFNENVKNPLLPTIKSKYEPKDLIKYSNNTTSFDESVIKLSEDLKNKYDIITDNLTISRILGNYYDVEKYYTLIKNNIPLSINTVTLSENAIGNPEVSVEVRNISKKDIDAFDITVYCYDRYGKPVGKYHNGSNIMTGSSNKVIPAGESGVSSWTLYGQELTTKVNVVLNKVHFTTGGTLFIKNKTLTKQSGKL